MKPQHLQYLLLVAGLLQIVQAFAGAIVSEMAGRGRRGVGGNMRDYGRHWGGRVELRGQCPTVPIWWSCGRHGRRLVGPKHRWCVSTQNVA